MQNILINDTHYPLRFTIRTLMELDSDLVVSLNDLLFKVDITTELQILILYYGIDKKVELEELIKWYATLSPQELNKLNVLVNGTLLESVGVGRETTDSNNTNEDSKEQSFTESMEDLLCYVVANIGISMTEFYNSTPNLMYKLCDAYMKKLEADFNLTTNAFINAWGLTHSKKFKPINPFKHENNSTTKVVDLDKKQEELDYLFNLGVSS